MHQDDFLQADQVSRILLADDDVEYALLLSRRLLRMGFEVEVLHNGSQAQEMVQARDFDLLVLDMYMPGCTGLEVIVAAQRKDPDLHAIIMTASATLENAIDALRVGVFEYLTKPFDSLQIFDMAVKRALERRYLVRENKRLFEETRRLAIVDQLTGLYNRHEMHRRFNLEIERTNRYQRPFTLLIMDLDRFKQINDRHGHPCGDLVLRNVGKAIIESIREIDIAARYGGDEFVVGMPESDLKTAVPVARRILQRIQEVVTPDGHVAASLGMAEWKQDFSTLEQLIQAADRALYRAKQTEAEKICVDIGGGSCVSIKVSEHAA